MRYSSPPFDFTSNCSAPGITTGVGVGSAASDAATVVARTMSTLPSVRFASRTATSPVKGLGRYKRCGFGTERTLAYRLAAGGTFLPTASRNLTNWSATASFFSAVSLRLCSAKSVSAAFRVSSSSFNLATRSACRTSGLANPPPA